MGAITGDSAAALLLAAGESRRFGGDKLVGALRGRPLLDYAAAALSRSPARMRLAVVPRGSPERRRIAEANGFTPVLSDGGPMSHSLRLGVAAAQAAGATAVLVALGDMPLIAPQHLRALFAAAAETGIAFTVAGEMRTAPALFGERWFARLQALAGDAGARAILETAPAASGVAAAAPCLADIDTPEDAERAARLLEVRRAPFSAC